LFISQKLFIFATSLS